jgi:PTH1 family peptidyl-tRNA hydrolase
MIVVHDEMELDLGAAAMRPWDRARRGHNGLRSIDSVLQLPQMRTPGEIRWCTIGVGIGRPSSRESEDVREFVLSKIRMRDMERIRSAGGVIWSLVSRFEKEWEQELTKGAGIDGKFRG